MQLTVPVPEELAQAHADFVEILEQRTAARTTALKVGSLLLFISFFASAVFVKFVGFPALQVVAPFVLFIYLDDKWKGKRHEFDVRLKRIKEHFIACGYAIVEDTGRGYGALVLKDYPDHPQSP